MKASFAYLAPGKVTRDLSHPQSPLGRHHREGPPACYSPSQLWEVLPRASLCCKGRPHLWVLWGTGACPRARRSWEELSLTLLVCHPLHAGRQRSSSWPSGPLTPAHGRKDGSAGPAAGRGRGDSGSTLKVNFGLSQGSWPLLPRGCGGYL